MKITPKIEFVEGSFETSTCEMVCVSKFKYKTVELGVRCDNSSWIVPVGEIMLYDSEKLVDATSTFEDAKKLGEEIARRWNACNEKK